MFDFTIFRQNLRDLINSKGMEVKDFSADIHIVAPTLFRYLSGDRRPDLEYVVRIADYFHVTVDWILGLTKERGTGLPKELDELFNLYQIASDSDKQVINMILAKYKRDEQ